MVSAATTSTTNMTGFFIKRRGSSLAKAAPIAGMTIFGSVKADTGMRLREVEVAMESVRMRGSEQRLGLHRELLDDRARAPAPGR